MKRWPAVFVATLLGVAMAQPPGKAAAIPDVTLKRVFPALTFERPVWMCQAPGDATHMYVVEQAGRIFVFRNEDWVTERVTFLDLRKRVLSYASGGHNEEGMLGLAFDPGAAKYPQFFVHYNADNPLRGVIARFDTKQGTPPRADPDSEKSVLEVPKPFGNHCGCCLLFGPDGYLYASFGDGGAAGDPFNHAQNLNSLLGKILRIDTRRETVAGRRYSSPDDNPFVKDEGARSEIWAYGLRNVWRMSFDRKTGDLWAGDVGQDRWEEIDLITRGGNYGWRVREGNHPFSRKTRPTYSRGTRPANTIIGPVVEYEHSEGLSITGGYVYRGKRFPELQGVYLYADYVLGTIWGLRHEKGKLQGHRVVLRQSRNIASFAEDAQGELYVLCFDGGIYRIEAK